ncbi:hypothetical protein FRC08_015370 [Ceratobasidium sp. 394]|nr:hypothetical protein FRC08_015370 [Ceratobasidium sp. 394]
MPDSNQVLLGEPAKANFSRLEVYTPWIEHLAIDLSERDTSDQAVDMLQYYSSTRILLPNLQSITSTSNANLVAVAKPWLLSILSPSLVSLDLISTSYAEIAFPPLPVLLHALSMNCPNLHTFAMIHNAGIGSLFMPISRILKYATSDYARVAEDLLKHGPGPALAHIHPLISFTTSIGTLDHFSWDVISAWPLLECLEIIMSSKDPDYSLPEIAESAFPSLRHLAIHTVDAVAVTFNLFWGIPALVSKLTLVKFVPAGRLCSSHARDFISLHQTLSTLVEQSPYIQDLWLNVRDTGARDSTLSVPISTLDILRRLPLQTLHLEGLNLTGCRSVPEYLTRAFPHLKKFGLPDHMLGFADLRTFNSQMPQLQSLSLGLDVGTLSPDLGVELDNIPRYRQSSFRTLEVSFIERNQWGPRTWRNHTQAILLVR